MIDKEWITNASPRAWVICCVQCRWDQGSSDHGVTVVREGAQNALWVESIRLERSFWSLRYWGAIPLRGKVRRRRCFYSWRHLKERNLVGDLGPRIFDTKGLRAERIES